MLNCFVNAKQELKGTIFESRMDSAFFNQDTISIMDRHHVKFTASVPFERFVQLKDMIEQRKRWSKIDEQWSFFETQWKPKSLGTSYRFIFTRKKTKRQRKGPIQQHLFEPRDFQFDYKVIVTNKTELAKNPKFPVYCNEAGGSTPNLG